MLTTAYGSATPKGNVRADKIGAWENNNEQRAQVLGLCRCCHWDHQKRYLDLEKESD